MTEGRDLHNQGCLMAPFWNPRCVLGPPGNFGSYFLPPWLQLKQIAPSCGEAVLVGVPTLCWPVPTYATPVPRVCKSGAGHVTGSGEHRLD